MHSLTMLGDDDEFITRFQKGYFRSEVFGRTVAINLLQNEGFHERSASDTEFFQRVKDCEFDEFRLCSAVFADYKEEKLILLLAHSSISQGEELLIELDFEENEQKQQHVKMLKSKMSQGLQK